jgi:hypothetical protein
MLSLFVEGGGDTENLKKNCRNAFTSFIQKKLEKIMPRVIACGSRNSAYEGYINAKRNGETAFLLVDSEGAVIVPINDPSYDQNDLRTWRPWHHIQNRKNAAGEYTHLRFYF